jgi:transposase-like protein
MCTIKSERKDRHVSDETKAKIIRLHNSEGLKVSALMERFGLARSTVKEILEGVK